MFKLNFPILSKTLVQAAVGRSRVTALPSIGISEFVSYMDPTVSLRYQISATFLQPLNSYKALLVGTPNVQKLEVISIWNLIPGMVLVVVR